MTAADDTPDKYATLAHLVAIGHTVGAAAKRLGIGRTQAYLHAKTPAFKELVRTIRGEFIGVTLGRLTTAATRAAGVLESLLDHEDANVRRQVAGKILDLLLSMQQQVDTADRVAAIEQQLAAATSSPPGRLPVWSPVRN